MTSTTRPGQISIGADTALDHEYPVDSDGDNVYEVTLQVNDGRDGDGNADTAVDDTVSVIITVTDINEPPEFGSSAVELEIDENTVSNTKVGDPIEATDPESDVLVYSVSGADSDFFDIDDSTGQISIGADTALDHEYPVDADGDNVYEVTLQVTDGKDENGSVDSTVDDLIDLTITVTDVNEPPEFELFGWLNWRSTKTRRRTRTSAIRSRQLRPRIRRAHLLPGRS